MSTFRIGQKVVCVDDRWVNPNINGPKNGDIVTFNGHNYDYGDAFYIKEYPICKNGRPQVFAYFRFRPITEHTASVSIEVIQSLPLTVKETIDTPQHETV